MEPDQRPLIGVDIDEVTLDYCNPLLEFYNAKHGTDFNREDIRTYRFEDIFGIPSDETVSELEEFAKTDLYLNMQPMPGAVEAMKRLSHHFGIEAITARTSRRKDLTKRQLDRHFRDLIDQIHFGRDEERNWIRTKGQICADRGIIAMVEDNFRYALDCADHGVMTLLMLAPWNRDEDIYRHKNIIPVKDWQQAEFYILSLIS